MKVVSLFIVLFVSSLLFFSCKTTKIPTCDNSVAAKLVNRNGLDGCGWAIELEEGGILEPLNLKEFDIKKKNNKKIWITYEETKGYVSICMIGPIIKVKCISDR